MKKPAAILLLLLLLFNLAGYHLWFYYAQQKSDAQLLAQLEQEAYNEDDLITLKVPLSLPYQTDWREFERVDGEITLEGKIYKYVKRKVQDGHLILLCLPDRVKTNLQTAKQDFIKLTHDLQTDSPSKGQQSKSIAFKNIVSDFEEHGQQWSLQQNDSQVKYNPPVNQAFKSPYAYSVIEQPPEA